MKASAIDTEIQKIDTEIDMLQNLRLRLDAMRGDGDSAPPKQKRTRKKKPGLPSAAPPASEANLAGTGRL